ncbi:N-acetyl sugar amidotransferase [Pelagibacterales bacterium SAG-MED01]|nr:N-acetyl sugar amidotransferase [Pelagibacterales bacterium SAG-MED01]
MSNNFFLKSCSSCMLPETYETFEFDKEGVCNVCNNHKHQKSKIDWNKRAERFEELVKDFRGKGDYDCLVPFSGGKDSTYVLYEIVVKHKLKPLVISFDHGFFREQHTKNIEKTLKILGTDHMVFKPNMKIVGKLMLESLKRKGDFCWHCHTGIFAYPMQIAVKFNIPLIIWGESQAEYNGYYDFDEKNMEEKDEESFNRYINLGINAEDMYGFIKDGVISERDLAPFKYPKLRDLKRIGYKSLCYGTFINWDPAKQTEIIMKELDWKKDEVEGLPPEFWMEKIECRVNGIRDWLKYVKRGFGRTAQSVAREIRLGKMTKEEGKILVDKYHAKKPKSLEYFLKIMDITEKEFMEIALKHQISPWQYDDTLVSEGKKLHDQDQWDDTPIR